MTDLKTGTFDLLPGVSLEAHSDLDRTTTIVAAYVSANQIQAGELPALIGAVYAAVSNLGPTLTAEQVTVGEPEVERPTPAQVRKSIKPEGLTSFIDGKVYKTLKRHLSKHGLDPVSYRARYGLPADYPMVSANYSAQRSTLAKSLGLGVPAARKAAA